MKKKLLLVILSLAVLSVLPFLNINAVENSYYYDTLKKESTVYVGNVKIDGVEALNYIYSDDIQNVKPVNYGKSVFDTLKEFLPLEYARLIPDNAQIGQTGIKYSSLHQEDMTTDWKNASYVANKYYITGTLGNEVNGKLYDINENYKADIDEEDARRMLRSGEPLSAEGRILAATSYTTQISDSTSYYFDIDAVTVYYTSVDVQTTPRPKYTLTCYSYDGKNELRLISREEIEEGTVINQAPVSPTLQGYFFDKWRDENGYEVTFPFTLDYNRRIYASWFKDIVNIGFVRKAKSQETLPAGTDIEEYIASKKTEFETQLEYFETKYNDVNIPDYSQMFSTSGTSYRYAIYNGYNLRSIVETDQIDTFTKSKTDEADVLYELVTVYIDGEAPKYIKGDMNYDKLVNSADAALVLDKFKNSNATFEDYDIGDMNEDDILNSTDAALILDIFKNA